MNATAIGQSLLGHGDARRTFETIAARLDAEDTHLHITGGWPAREAAMLAVEEVWCSALLAGVPLALPEVATLLATGRTAGLHSLDAYVMVADYAAAGRFVAAAPLPGRRHPFLRLEEIVQLHALATRREPAAGAGTWRSTTAHAFASGTVPPPAWLVPREMSAFAERFSSGPPAGQHRLAWVASAHERFARIHPFAKANGRVNRLLTNLLLRRVGLPPFAVRGGAARRYLAALAQADSRNPWPLAAVMGRAISASLARLTAAAAQDGELRPLATFAAAGERAALYKASQRGRLRTVRRAGALLTTAAWIAEYEASRASRAPV